MWSDDGANEARMLRNDAAGIVRDLNECQRRYEYATAAAKERIEGEMSKMVARLTEGDRITYRDDAGVWRLVLTEEERTEDAALATTRKEPTPVAGYTVHEKDGVVTLEFTNGAEKVAVQMPVGDAERLGSRLKGMAEIRHASPMAATMQTIVVPEGAPAWNVESGLHFRAPEEIWTTAEYQPEVERFEFAHNGWRWSVRKQDVRVVARQSNGRPYGSDE
jgi:hypothetical protein